MDDLPEPSAASATPSLDAAWQRRLLPLMVRMVVGLALFFFVVTLGQLAYLHWELSKPMHSEIPAAVHQLVTQETPFSGDRKAAELGIAAMLEDEALARRYQMGSIILMAHIWIRYLGFVTGMVMAMIGSVFILGKLSDPGESKLGAESQALKVSLTSASPGLVLATLGVALIIVTVLAQQETRITDRALYAPFAVGERRPQAEKVPEFFKPSPSDTGGKEKGK